MRPPIYKPSGAAAEYGEWALNIYNGCPHACSYCYVPQVLHCDRAAFHAHCEPRPGIEEETRKQLRKTGMTGQTIFLCFTCDPYPTGYNTSVTREIIKSLKESGNHVKVLTKGDGSRDFDLLDGNDWYGVTVDGSSQGYSNNLRVADLAEAKQLRIHTWVSCEPVLYPDAVLRFLEESHSVIDHVKIGKLNYKKPPVPVDWAAFGDETERLCQNLGLDYYIKSSLRKEMERHE